MRDPPPRRSTVQSTELVEGSTLGRIQQIASGIKLRNPKFRCAFVQDEREEFNGVCSEPPECFLLFRSHEPLGLTLSCGTRQQGYVSGFLSRKALAGRRSHPEMPADVFRFLRPGARLNPFLLVQNG
jgi:hypothetical protein